MKVCVITDNQFIYEQFLLLIRNARYGDVQFDFYCSPGNMLTVSDREKDLSNTPAAGGRRQGGCGKLRGQIRLKETEPVWRAQYGLFLSLHCKQLFPATLTDEYRCINVHPGYNPYNRGWYPQVFGILNRLPVGVTIHEMDRELDHGPIIVRRQIAVHDWDTSFDIYARIQQTEVELLREYLPVLLSGAYRTSLPEQEGNINLEKDFKALCRLDPEETLTWREAIDHLRALSFHGYRNAYFYGEDGQKIYVDIRLERE